jgi:O-antigen/teichoic acid export membrane protein
MLGTAFISSIIIANSLGLNNFGIYTLFFSFTGILVLFFRFGYFSSISVLLASTNNINRKKEILGAGFVLVTIIGLLYIIFLYLLSGVVSVVFKTNLESFIDNNLIFLIVLPAGMYLTQIAQATNRFTPVILFNIVSSLASLLMILYYYYNDLFSIENFIYAKLLPTAILTIIAIYMYSFSFKNLIKNLLIINIKNKKHGFHLYLGQIADQITYKSDELMISFFIGNSELGLYKIANSLTQPLSMLPKNYSLLKFKQFAKSKFVNKKEFHNLLMIILIVFLIGVVLIYVIMNYFYAKEFFDALYIAYILLFAVIMNSIYQMHNMFMNANSMGKIIKNNSLKMMLVNIIMNFTLIPFLGAIGASIASVMSIYTYMYFTFKEYKKFINGEKNSVK